MSELKIFIGARDSGELAELAIESKSKGFTNTPPIADAKTLIDSTPGLESVEIWGGLLTECIPQIIFHIIDHTSAAIRLPLHNLRAYDGDHGQLPTNVRVMILRDEIKSDIFNPRIQCLEEDGSTIIFSQ